MYGLIVMRCRNEDLQRVTDTLRTLAYIPGTCNFTLFKETSHNFGIYIGVTLDSAFICIADVAVCCGSCLISLKNQARNYCRNYSGQLQEFLHSLSLCIP